jgi:hypothetical protein
MYLEIRAPKVGRLGLRGGRGQLPGRGRGERAYRSDEFGASALCSRVRDTVTDGMRWERVEQTILEALAVGDGTSMGDQELQEATGLDVPPLMHALRSLKEDGYIDAALIQPDQADYPVRAASVRLLPKGLRQAGLWPAEDLSSAFCAALERAIGEEADPQRRSSLERVLIAARTVGNMTLSAVIANAIGIGRSHLGLG